MRGTFQESNSQHLSGVFLNAEAARMTKPQILVLSLFNEVYWSL